jgi:VWFA-related protein
LRQTCLSLASYIFEPMKIHLPVFAALSVVLATGQSTTPSFRSESNVVLAPALVMRRSGEIIYGLQAEDFVLEDNGMAQNIRIDDAPDTQPISLVVAVQRSGSAYLHFKHPEAEETKSGFSEPHHKESKTAIGDLGTMVEQFVGASKTEVALVGFDNQVELLHEFTESVPEIVKTLDGLTSSDDGGASLLDAVRFSLDLLDTRTDPHTKVLLLVSEQRDHGSGIKLEDIVERITRSNVLIYSLSFSPLRAETMRDLKGQNPDPGAVDLSKMIYLASNAFRKNSAKAVAELAGGEYLTFKDAGTFDRDLTDLANHVRSRYLISFQPKNPEAGPHSITIRLRVPNADVVVIARDKYWAAGNIFTQR